MSYILLGRIDLSKKRGRREQNVTILMGAKQWSMLSFEEGRKSCMKQKTGLCIDRPLDNLTIFTQNFLGKLCFCLFCL